MWRNYAAHGRLFLGWRSIAAPHFSMSVTAIYRQLGIPREAATTDERLLL